MESSESGINGRAVVEAIEALEKRVSELAARDRHVVYKVANKVQSEPAVAGPNLTKPGHADQFKFCEEIKVMAAAALGSLHLGDDEPLDVAVDTLQRIVEATEARQKLIRMADRSDLGWRVVQHYVADPIADSAEDEKRIKNATKSAAAELKAVQEKKGEYIAFDKPEMLKMSGVFYLTAENSFRIAFEHTFVRDCQVYFDFSDALKNISATEKF